MARIPLPGALVLAALLVTPAAAQVARPFVVEGQVVGGVPVYGVGVLGNSGVGGIHLTQVGGYSVGVHLDDDGDLTSAYYGSPVGGPPKLLRVEQQLGPNKQLGFGISQYTASWGINKYGQAAYRASWVVPPDEIPSFDGAWLDDRILFDQGDVVASDIELLWCTDADGLRITASGEPIWGGRIGDGGFNCPQGIFIGKEQDPLIFTGDVLPGLSGPLLKPSYTDFDVSNAGNLVIVGRVTGVGDAVIVGSAETGFEGVLESGSSTTIAKPAASDAGDWAVTYRQFSPSGPAFIVKNGVFLYEEGVPFGGVTPMGVPQELDLNNDGDLAFSWGVAPQATPSIFVNGQLVLSEGDPVDLDGDGVGEVGTSITDLYNGLLEVSDRDLAGDVTVYFHAYVDVAGTPQIGDDMNGVFSVTWNAGPGVAVAPIDIVPSDEANVIPAASGLTPGRGLSVAVLGTPTFDVTQIDPTTLTLARQDGEGGTVAVATGAPIGFGDERTPAAYTCAPSLPAPDGILDAIVWFDRAAIAGLLDGLAPVGVEVPLVLSGELQGGAPFGGRDCVRLSQGILAPGPAKKL